MSKNQNVKFHNSLTTLLETLPKIIQVMDFGNESVLSEEMLFEFFSSHMVPC